MKTIFEEEQILVEYKTKNSQRLTKLKNSLLKSNIGMDKPEKAISTKEIKVNNYRSKIAKSEYN